MLRIKIFFTFIRARFGDDSLVCLSYSYISQNILPTIDIKKLEGSFNRYLDEIGINRSYGYTELGVALPDENKPNSSDRTGSSLETNHFMERESTAI